MANNTNWLNISATSGSSGQTILTLSAQRNLSTDYKTAEITAYNPVYNISAKTYVTLESYAPILDISPTLFPVADSGGTFELSITANCAWVISFPDLVSTYSTSAGTGNATITFSVPSTTADTTLVGNIVVTDESGQMSKIARIEQYGSGAHIGIFPVELYFDTTGGTKTFAVTADCAYSVYLASGTDWASVEPNSGYTGQTIFTVTVTGSNTGSTIKTGGIIIDAPGTGGAVALYQRKPETRMVVGYWVSSTTEPTVIMCSSGLNAIAMAEYPDGTQITPATAYTFPSTGMQYVYYTLTGDTLPDSIFDVGYSAELGETLRSVSIPEGITDIGAFCFYGNGISSLSSVTLPSTLESISYGCFQGCISLSSITLPDALVSISSDCFRDCTSLSSVTFGSGITSIGANCFNRCTSLTEIVIPPSVTSIGSYCFGGSGLETIYFSSPTPPTLGNASALTSNNLQEIIVPCRYYNEYITAWPQYEQYITCQDTELYFITDTSNVKGIGETRTITILNSNINENSIGLTLPSDFPAQGSYVVVENVIYLTYPANPSSSLPRTWTIGVVAQTMDGDSLAGHYTITQDAYSIIPISYTADTSVVDASGETRTITIDTSGLVESSITISVEGATGVTTTYQNGVITVIFPENTGSFRNIDITITALTNNGDEASVVIRFLQSGGAFTVDAIYNVTSTTEPTQILAGLYYQYVTSGDGISGIGKAEYDGTEIELSTGFTFPTTGLQMIKYTLTAEIIPGATVAPNSLGWNWGNLPNETISYAGRFVPNRQFQGLSSLVSISFSDGVYSVGEYCCDLCDNLETITFGPDMRSVYNNICGSRSLTNVTFLSPELPVFNYKGKKNNLNSDYTFGYYRPGRGISGLSESFVWYYKNTASQSKVFDWEVQIAGKKRYIPDGNDATISVTYNITSVGIATIANSTTELGFYDGASKQVKSYNFYLVEFPDGSFSSQFEDVKKYNFSSTGLQTIKYYLTGTSLDTGCFSGLSNIQSVSADCKTVGNLSGCSLTGVVLSNNVTTILKDCFANCTSLVTVHMGRAVSSLGSGAFMGCTALRNIIWSEYITTIPYKCFGDCTSLEQFTFPSTGWKLNTS